MPIYDYHNQTSLWKYKDIEIYLTQMGYKKMKIKVEKSQKLPEGKYTGIIKDVKKRDIGDYTYIDVVIQEDVSMSELSYSIPQNLTKSTKLGILLSEFCDILEGAEIELDILLNQKVSFMILLQKTEKGEFSRIVDNSIRKL